MVQKIYLIGMIPSVLTSITTVFRLSKFNTAGEPSFLIPQAVGVSQIALVLVVQWLRPLHHQHQGDFFSRREAQAKATDITF